MKFFLRDNNAYSWYEQDGNFFKGYFIVGDILYRESAAVDYLRGLLKSSKPFFHELHYLDGVYAFILTQDHSVYFGVDRLRGLPLFYAIVDKDLWIGDNATQIVQEMSSPKLDRKSVEEYRSSCLFVTGSNTLIQDFHQVRAAECGIWHSDTCELEREQYFRTEHSDFYPDEDLQTIEAAFHDAYRKTGSNLVNVLAGRTAVIPLSGGADSRMIVSMLKEQKYENVICFTYGTEGNHESEISKSVAAEYGYRWLFIPYTPQLFSALRVDEEAKRYNDFAFAYSSTPHFQDYCAVREMKRRKLIPDNSVFVPGHSGDIPNGNHVNPLYLSQHVSRDECLNSMCRFAYTKHPAQFAYRLLEEYPLPENGTPQDYATIEEWMDTAERQAKFIVNSVRVYEFFGYEWLIPLWDNTQFDYWKKVSLQWRCKRKLYYKIVNDALPSTNDQTLKKRFEHTLRKIPGVHQVSSKIRRFQNWWKSPFYFEHFFTGFEYAKSLITQPSAFDFNTMYCNYLLDGLEQEFRSE